MWFLNCIEIEIILSVHSVMSPFLHSWLKKKNNKKHFKTGAQSEIMRLGNLLVHLYFSGLLCQCFWAIDYFSLLSTSYCLTFLLVQHQAFRVVLKFEPIFLTFSIWILVDPLIFIFIFQLRFGKYPINLFESCCIQDCVQWFLNSILEARIHALDHNLGCKLLHYIFLSDSWYSKVNLDRLKEKFEVENCDEN